MSDSAEQIFRLGVRQGLAKLDSQIEGGLRSLVRHEYPPEVFALSFGISSDGFTSGFPVRAFFMDRSNTEHFLWEGEQAKYPSPVDPGLLEIAHVYAEELEEELEEHSPGSDPWDIATEELIQWFAKHWQQVGGANFPLVATIAAHDSSREFNLKSGGWQPSYAEFDA
ncbi:MAG: hypothetical protein EOP20_02200 [Hyphomicrobiales bacterium]|nr:MAG: hypothetical protein EOP20_02200 [Hyphomicrobiales bacterium]